QIPTRGPRGERVIDDVLLLLFNAHDDVVEFMLPSSVWGAAWKVLMSTADPVRAEGAARRLATDPVRAEGAARRLVTYGAGEVVAVQGRSLTVLAGKGPAASP